MRQKAAIALHQIRCHAVIGTNTSRRACPVRALTAQTERCSGGWSGQYLSHFGVIVRLFKKIHNFVDYMYGKSKAQWLEELLLQVERRAIGNCTTAPSLVIAFLP